MLSNEFDISRENAGLELIKQFPIIERFYGSPIKYFFEDDSDEQVNLGADFQLENGDLIDLKSEIGFWKPDKYYDSLVLSIERDQSSRYGQEDINQVYWKDCLLSKKTCSWFFPVQTSTYFINFYKISREQAFYIKNNYKIFIGFKGGKWQKYVIIPLQKFDTNLNKFVSNLDITQADFYLNLKQNELISLRGGL